MSERQNGASDELLPGVIDSFGDGFAVAITRPLLIVPLVVLELVLLFSPRLTVGHAADEVADRVRGHAGWVVVEDEIRSLGGYNLLDLATWGLPRIRVAAVASFVGEQNDVPGWHDRRVVTAGALAAPLAVLSLIAGLVFVAAYRLLLAAGMGSGTPATNLRPGSLASLVVRFATAALAVAGLLALVGLPVVLATLLLAAFHLQGAALLWLALLAPVVWGVIHFYFVIHALVVDRLGVLPAFRASYRVVRRDRWQAARFIAVSLLLSTGLTYLLESIARRPEWAVLAVILNAFFATGMILAAMLFYRDRARLLGLSSLQEGA